MKGHTEGTSGSQHFFFPMLPEESRNLVRIYVQAPTTLHPGAIYSESMSIMTEKKTQTASGRLLSYVASKALLAFTPLFCFRLQGLGALQISYTFEQKRVDFGSNPSNNSNNCKAELLLLERLKQREIQLVPKSIISLHKLLLG